MKEYKSEKMKLDSLLPTTLDIQRILKVRSLTFNQKDQYILERQEAGANGEQTVFDFIKIYGEENWIVIRNFWMNYSGEQEYDLILITRHACYIFEVKNYNHLFTLEDGICKLNGKFMDKHIITQTIRCTKNLQQIFARLSLNIKVQGTLVFIGDHSRVQMNDPVTEIDIIQKNELRDYIRLIALEEKNSQKTTISPETIIQALEKYEIRNPHPAEPITIEQAWSLKRGIHCPICDSFDINLKKNWLVCSCGTKESKEETVIRTICEYGVLNFTSHLKKVELRAFMNNQISDNFLRKILVIRIILTISFHLI